VHASQISFVDDNVKQVKYYVSEIATLGLQLIPMFISTAQLIVCFHTKVFRIFTIQ